MQHLPTMNEYSNLVRVSENTAVPSGYAFVSEFAVPVIVKQLTRQLTFARGRILYEVFDEWKEIVIGYIAPESIVALALQYKDGVSRERFDKVPEHERRVAMHTYQLVRYV